MRTCGLFGGSRRIACRLRHLPNSQSLHNRLPRSAEELISRACDSACSRDRAAAKRCRRSQTGMYHQRFEFFCLKTIMQFPVHFDYEDVEHNSVSSAMSSVARPSSCGRNSANETRSTPCESHARSRRLFRSNRDHERSGLKSAGRSLLGLSAGYFQIASWALLKASTSWKLAQPGVQVFGTITYQSANFHECWSAPLQSPPAHGCKADVQPFRHFRFRHQVRHSVLLRSDRVQYTLYIQRGFSAAKSDKESGGRLSVWRQLLKSAL